MTGRDNTEPDTLCAQAAALGLTNVEAVYEGWGTPAARPIQRMTVARAESLIEAVAKSGRSLTELMDEMPSVRTAVFQCVAERLGKSESGAIN